MPITKTLAIQCYFSTYLLVLSVKNSLFKIINCSAK